MYENLADDQLEVAAWNKDGDQEWLQFVEEKDVRLLDNRNNSWSITRSFLPQFLR